MTRKGKVLGIGIGLGLVLVTALVMSAMVASPVLAEGEEFTAESYPATVTGTGELTFGYEGITEVCKSSTYHATLTEASTMLEITPTFEECQQGGGKVVSTLNGCTFQKTPKEKINIHKFKIITHLVCPPNKQWEKHQPNNCTVTIPPQKEMFIDIFEIDTPTKKAKVIHEITTVEYTMDKGAGCPQTAGTFTKGSLTGTLSLSATSGESSVGFHVG